MSRTADMRLSGWVMDSNLFDNDLRFVDLLENKGAVSILIYIIMRGLICSKYGYYAILDNSFILRVHRTLGRCSKGQAHIKDTILYFGKIGILDKCLLKDNILTSKDIQESWLVAKRAKRAKITNNLEHWLLIDILPSIDNDNCSSKEDKCNNNSDKCSNIEDNYIQDNTRHDSELIKEKNINISKKQDLGLYNADKVLDIVLGKDIRGVAWTTYKLHPQYEHYRKYANYIANACNDTRLNKYGGDTYYIDNDFFIAWLHSITHHDLFMLFNECYRQNSNITASTEYYLRGIIYNQNKKLALKYKKQFV